MKVLTKITRTIASEHPYTDDVRDLTHGQLIDAMIREAVIEGDVIESFTLTLDEGEWDKIKAAQKGDAVASHEVFGPVEISAHPAKKIKGRAY